MPTYHFKLVDATTAFDQGGRSFERDKQAIGAATEMANGMFVARPELRDRGFKILVTDEAGEEVYLAPLDPMEPF